MMIILKCDQVQVSSAYATYQIVRRDGAVVSFEPSKIATAVMNAFLALHGSLPNAGALKTLVKGVLTALFERVSGWDGWLRLPALDFKRALLVQATLVRRSNASGVPVGVSVGRGFFSATKPNLRNAP